MLPRSLTATLLTAALALVLVGCAPEEQGTLTTEGPQPELEIIVDGPTWSAAFPGVALQEEQPFPVEGIGELTADLTYWESSNEAVLVQVVTLPESEGDAAANLINTAANVGTIVPDSPLLDSDGTFRGLPAVVVETNNDGTLVELLAFVDGATLYQLIFVTSSADTPDRLAALVASFELR